MLSLLLLLPCFLQAQQESVTTQQLRQQLNRSLADSTRARLEGLLAWELRFSKPAEAIELADSEILLAKQLNDPLRLADGYRVKALTLVIAEKIPDGMADYDTALVYARKAGSLYYQASCYSLMAGMYGDHGDYDKAIELYAAGLTLAQQTNDPHLIATLSNNLAESYQSDGRETTLVQQYFSMALENSMKSGHWADAAMNAGNLAREYLNIGDTSAADAALTQAVELMNRDRSDVYRYGTTLHVLASVYLDLGKNGVAEMYALASLRIMDSLQRPDNALRPLTVLTSIYIAEKNLPQAERTATRLLNDGLAQHAKLYIRDGYKALSDIARLKKNDAEALRYYELYKAWNDSVFRADRERSISDMETRAALAQKELAVKYETEKKEAENANLKARNENLQSEKLLAIAACLVFVLLGVLLWLANRKKQKINAELEAEKKIVERQAQEKSMLVHEIHHRVKNNLTMLKSLLYLQSRASSQHEVKEILSECQARIQSMALVHQNLYGETDAGTLDFTAFLQSLFAELSNSFQSSEGDVSFSVTGHCPPMNISHSIALGLVMNELVTNSLKYAFAAQEDGEIRVDMHSTDQQLRIRYSDNGPGLPKPFDLAEGGFGFRLLDLLSRQLNAQLTYARENEESVFVLVLPL